MYSLKKNLKKYVWKPLIKTKPVQNYGLDTSDITVTLIFDLQNLISSSMSHSGPLYQTGTNSVEAFLIYLQAKYKHLAAVTLSFDLQNLNRSTLNPSGPSYQIWRNSLKAFLTYRSNSLTQHVVLPMSSPRNSTIKLFFLTPNIPSSLNMKPWHQEENSVWQNANQIT